MAVKKYMVGASGNRPGVSSAVAKAGEQKAGRLEPEIRTLIDISESQPSMQALAELYLDRARWASQVFLRYDRDAVMRIVDAVAETAHQHALKYAEWAVEESGFGVVDHKKIKNELTAHPLVAAYADVDFVSPRIDAANKIVEIPRPAGVIFALVPSTNPISTVNFKIILAMLTRNAIVLSPHPAVKECCIDAVTTLAAAAEAAGAPPACIQVVDTPRIPLIEEFMKSAKTNVVLATGGTAMVRAAYSSSNPAIGVGPGNAPVYVDPSADFKKAAHYIVESKSFDNSVLCTNESVLITVRDCHDAVESELKKEGAHICSAEETAMLRNFLFHAQGFNIEAIGQDAIWIAEKAGIKVSPKTKILVAPITKIGIEEPLSKEKLCPVLAMHVISSPVQAVASARAVLRLTGAGHSAAIHARDERMIFEFSSQVECYRCVVNAPCSQGAAGFGTGLAPTFTIGTGYFGRSSVGENVGPQHLVHYTRIAWNSSPDEPFGNFEGIHQSLAGPLPEAPSDGVPGKSFSSGRRSSLRGAVRDSDLDHAELRRLIAEELRHALRGDKS